MPGATRRTNREREDRNEGKLWHNGLDKNHVVFVRLAGVGWLSRQDHGVHRGGPQYSVDAHVLSSPLAR